MYKYSNFFLAFRDKVKLGKRIIFNQTYFQQPHFITSDYKPDSVHVLGVMNTDDHKSTNNVMAIYVTFKMTIHIVNR